jgi:dTDP-4-amino-4,6-dideoxygalactose transaminase
VDGITLNYEPPGTKNTYWMVTVVLDERFGLKKERPMEMLAAQGIGCRPFFHPLSSLPAYAHSAQAALPSIVRHKYCNYWLLAASDVECVNHRK